MCHFSYIYAMVYIFMSWFIYLWHVLYIYVNFNTYCITIHLCCIKISIFVVLSSLIYVLSTQIYVATGFVSSSTFTLTPYSEELSSPAVACGLTYPTGSEITRHNNTQWMCFCSCRVSMNGEMLKGQFSHSIKYKRVRNEKCNNSLKGPHN